METVRFVVKVDRDVRCRPSEGFSQHIALFDVFGAAKESIFVDYKYQIRNA